MGKFNNGQKYPILGLGTWQSTLEIEEQNNIYEAVQSAIDLGYRHFDCAPFYNNEKFVGLAITAKIREGVIKREDVCITSKVSNDKLNPEFEVEVALMCTLQEIGLTYLDLYLIHCPTTEIENQNQYKMEIDNICDIWKAMEKCVYLGLTKSIGMSNFNKTQVQAILDIATIKPVINQIKLQPHHSQNELIEFCENHSVVLSACEPLGLPESANAVMCYVENCIVKLIARKYNKTNFQVMIKFQMQRGIIAIVKSTRPEILMEKFDVWDFELDLEDTIMLEFFYSNLRMFQNAELVNEIEDLLVDQFAVEQ